MGKEPEVNWARVYNIAVRIRLRRSSSSGSVSREGEDAGEVRFAALSMCAGAICCPAMSATTLRCFACSVCSAISFPPAIWTERATKSFFWLRSRLGDGDEFWRPFLDAPDSRLRLFEAILSLSSENPLVRLEFSGVGISSSLSGSDDIRLSLCSEEGIRSGHCGIGEGIGTVVRRVIPLSRGVLRMRGGSCDISKKLVLAMSRLDDGRVDIGTAVRSGAYSSCDGADESRVKFLVRDSCSADGA